MRVLSSENDEEIGKIGKIIRDDQDGRPYKLAFDGVPMNKLFQEADVRRTTMVRVVRLVPPP